MSLSRKSVNSKLVSSLPIETNVEESVKIATTTITLAKPLSMKIDAFFVISLDLTDFWVDCPVERSDMTCIAPTVTVVAMNAHTTPIASVVPNALRGSMGDNAFERNAVTVVMTDRDSASLNTSNELVQARDGLIPSESFLSYPFCMCMP